MTTHVRSCIYNIAGVHVKLI